MNDDYEHDVKVIGLEKYPIFDNGYRPTLNEKIVNRFWMREIGFETDTMFRHYMRARMNEIMPFYNDLYRTTMVKFDMFNTMDIVSQSTDQSTAEADSETTSNAESGSTSNSKSRAVSHETPQGLLSDNGDYATAAQDSVSETGSKSDSKGTDKSGSRQEGRSESENRTTGSQGSKSAMLMEFRDTIINIDVMILGQLEDLFMQVWSNGDDYSGRRAIVPPRFYQYPLYM